MILSVEHKHPTARKRLRSLMTLVTLATSTTCGCEACRLIAEEERRPDATGPSGGEAECEDPRCLFVQ